MPIKIGLTTYGHTNPNNPSQERNAMLLVNWGMWNSVQKAAIQLGGEALDFSPPLDPGIRHDLHGDLSEMKPVDVLVFQGGVSLHRVRHAMKLNPNCILIEQRESTHASQWLKLMKAAQHKHGIVWFTNYDNPSCLTHDIEEYELARKILVPSKFVQSTFEAEGLGSKVACYGPTVIEFWDVLMRRPGTPFVVSHVAQLGIRKGTLEAFEGWRLFKKKNPDISAIFNVIGLPEHGAPPELAKRIKHEFSITPEAVGYGWLDRKHLRSTYARSHALLAPSVEDGATMAGYEAGYAGCAIVSTFNAGIDLPRLNVETPADIAATLERLAKNFHFCEKFGMDAHNTAKKFCDLESYSNRVSKILVETIS